MPGSQKVTQETIERMAATGYRPGGSRNTLLFYDEQTYPAVYEMPTDTKSWGFAWNIYFIIFIALVFLG